MQKFIDKLNIVSENKWFNLILLPANVIWIYHFFKLIVPLLWTSTIPGILTILTALIVLNEFISSFNDSLKKFLEK